MELGKFASDDFEVEVAYGAPEDQAFVTLRYMPIEKARELYAKATKTSYAPGNHQPTSKTDEDKFARLWGEWAVIGWRGFEVDGQEYAFTPEHRDALMTAHRKFKAFVMQVADDIQALTQAEREKVRGNGYGTCAPRSRTRI